MKERFILVPTNVYEPFIKNAPGDIFNYSRPHMYHYYKKLKKIYVVFQSFF